MPVDSRKLNTICPNCFATLDKSGFCFNCKKRLSALSNPVLTLPMGTILNNRFMVGHTLGMGGFGITYYCWDLLTCSKVAIKEFFPRGYTTRVRFSTEVTVLQQNFSAAFNHWLSAFIQEAQILTNINHLHGIVKIQDFFQANNTAYIVMDYLEGMSLKKYVISRGGIITFKDLLNIIRPVMESLLALHQNGIIHKDISPENIQIVQNRFVKLIDFGAASIYNQNIIKPYIVLKQGYSPIELYTSNMKQGPWSDVYEVGATIYSCITGLIPPEATARSQRDSLYRPSQYGVKIPAVQENSLMKSLSVNPSGRYDNMGEFIQMLYGELLPKTVIR